MTESTTENENRKQVIDPEFRLNDPHGYLKHLCELGTRSEYLTELRERFQLYTPNEILDLAGQSDTEFETLRKFATFSIAELRLTISLLMQYLGLEDAQGNPIKEKPPESKYETVRQLEQFKKDKMPKTDIVFRANRMQAQALTSGRDDAEAENNEIRYFLRKLF